MNSRSLSTALPRAVLFAAILLAGLLLAVSLYSSTFAQEADDPGGYAENGMGPVATYTAYDPEGQGIDWDVRGTDSALFSIDENGVLTFKDSPNYEDPKDVAHAADGDFEGDTEERCG